MLKSILALSFFVFANLHAFEQQPLQELNQSGRYQFNIIKSGYGNHQIFLLDTYTGQIYNYCVYTEKWSKLPPCPFDNN